MKQQLTFLLMLVFFQMQAQSDIKIGKKMGTIFNKTISEINIGAENGYMQPIYFKVNESDEWRRTGFLAKKLKPYLFADENAKQEYLMYKKQAKLSYVTLGTAYVCVLGWSFTSVNNLSKGKPFIESYFGSANSLAWLGAYFGTFYGSIYLNKLAETHLFKAVNIKNGRFSTSVSENGIGMKVHF
jgi:hypothetical protein